MADIGWGEEEWDYSQWDSNDAFNEGNTETTEAEARALRDTLPRSGGIRRRVGWRLKAGEEIR